jgi:hypothetical protein
MITALIIKLVVGGSLDYMWKIVNIIQIIAFLQLFNYIDMPGFSQEFFANLNYFNVQIVDKMSQLSSFYPFVGTMETWRDKTNIFTIIIDFISLILQD